MEEAGETCTVRSPEGEATLQGAKPGDHKETQLPNGMVTAAMGEPLPSPAGDGDSASPVTDVLEEMSSVESTSKPPEPEPVDTQSVPLLSPTKLPTEPAEQPIQEDRSRTNIEGPSSSVYHIKWVKWKDSQAPIVTQNENGPCPLIAIINVLILSGRVTLPSIIEMITVEQLMEYLGDCMLRAMPKDSNEGVQLNFEQNMSDAMAVLPKLQTGLDVNVKFTGVRHFEYTPECIIFDLLNIPLYHGWLIDPQDMDILTAVGTLSYNQLVEKIISDKASTNPDVATGALIAESFLERSASQLTYHGLCELSETMNHGELAVFFRNNHFSTVYKKEKELFQLVTDQGFLTENNVVWETLSNIEGDGQFVDSMFVTVPPKASAPPAGVVSVEPSLLDPETQVDHDYMVALSIQSEQEAEARQQREWAEYKEKHLGTNVETSDEELARRLQAEEERRATACAAPSTSTAPSNDRPKKKERDCSIL